MMVLMVVGCCQLKASYERCEIVSDYVISLQNKNVELSEKYYSGFDPVDIHWKATALGMIPMEEAKTVTMTVTVPEEEPAPTIWENVVWFLEGLLA